MTPDSCLSKTVHCAQQASMGSLMCERGVTWNRILDGEQLRRQAEEVVDHARARYGDHGSDVEVLMRPDGPGSRGLDTVAPNERHASVTRFRSGAFVGLPCPKNAAGLGERFIWSMVGYKSSRARRS